MSKNTPVPAICKVCGAPLAGAVCQCGKCQTPAHAECFAYSNGCSVYGCGSSAARFESKPPEGWRENADGTWLVPLGARGGTMNQGLDRFVGHWRTTAQMELFVVLGQAWFAGVTLAMTLIGRWTLAWPLQCAVAIALVAHANTLIGLVRVGLTLTSGEDIDPAAGPRRALVMRVGTITRSRALHVLATVLLAAGLAMGGVATPPYTRVIAIFVALVPWFSLNPRWGLERLLLQTLQRAAGEKLPAGQS